LSSAALFLGAGASSAFGYPTTKEFMKNLRVSEDDEGILDWYKKYQRLRI